MAIQGVKGSIFELLLSNDKKVQDFIATLKAGDTLRGRVVELLPAENKAIINFKGYNLVSQLPQDTLVQKGDIINVTVSQADSRIFMKIGAEALGRSVDLQQGAQTAMSPQQIMQALNQMKIPVNEQNLFIAQKLIDYHLPVTPENIANVNDNVNSYLQSRGIDTRTFNMDGLPAAKELTFTNFFRLGLELQKAAESLRNMEQVMETRGQYIMTRNDFIVKAGNIINILGTAAAATGGAAVLSSDQAGMTLSLNNPDTSTLKSVFSAAVSEGVLTQEQAQNALKALESGVKALQAGTDISVSRNGAKVEIKYSGVTANLEALSSPQPGIAGAAGLKDAFTAGITRQAQTAAPSTQSVINRDITGILSTDAKALVLQSRDLFAALGKNIFTPQNTSLNENVRETAALVKSFHATLTNLAGALGNADVKASSPEWMSFNELQSGVFKALDSSKALIKNLFQGNEQGQLTVKPSDYSNYQSAIKNFMLKNAAIELFREAAAVIPGTAKTVAPATAVPVQANLPVDVESTIEAMIFLKSRNLPADNRGFVDIMARFFKNDMKLSRGLENLNTDLTRLESVFKHAQGLSQMKPAMEAALALKNIIGDVTVKTNDSSLKAGIIEAQFRNFIDKSGLNLENRLMNNVFAPNGAKAYDAAAGLTSGQQGKQAPNAANEINKETRVTAGGAPVDAAGDNLKSKLVDFLNKIAVPDDPKISAAQKQIIRQVRETASDLLTNLNALSLMNQRPVSFDMAYTQVPVFFNNKLFNGELQVWYRKGAPKEELKAQATPINMVFMLNTSNLGPIKVSMTVYKNEVECNVKAENEKAKQALMRNKNEFLGNLTGINYNVKSFNVQVENEAAAPPSSGEGYINVGSINLQA